MRIVEQRERDAPIRDAAGRIGLGGVLEDFLRLRVPERMLVAHAAVEAALRDVVARCREMHGAEALVDVVLREGRLR